MRGLNSSRMDQRAQPFRETIMEFFGGNIIEATQNHKIWAKHEGVSESSSITVHLPHHHFLVSNQYTHTTEAPS